MCDSERVAPAVEARPRRCDPALLRTAARVAARRLGASADAQREELEAGALVDLYQGPLGGALFWAASARVDPDSAAESRARSLRALAAPRAVLARWSAKGGEMDTAGIRLGGVSGLGGAVYALTCVGALLGEPDLVAEALAASALVTRRRIASDDLFDVVDGSAGAILSLLALANSLPPEMGASRRGELVEQAVWCAEHLVDRRRGGPDAPGGWGPEGRPSYGGFAHGAAGIGFALLRCYEQAPRPAFLEAAIEAMRFERTLYRPALRNWRPYAGSPEADRPMTAWCWGAPGIALARIAGLRVLDGPEIRQEIQDALETTRAARQTAEDHVCCGNLGRAMILDFAARALAGTRVLPDAAALRADADRIAHDVLRHAKGRGDFGWSRRPAERGLRGSFFKGAAGLGFALLYLAEPEALPLPLLLESPIAAVAA